MIAAMALNNCTLVTQPGCILQGSRLGPAQECPWQNSTLTPTTESCHSEEPLLRHGSGQAFGSEESDAAPAQWIPLTAQYQIPRQGQARNDRFAVDYVWDREIGFLA
jgi:hypothetical protein